MGKDAHPINVLINSRALLGPKFKKKCIRIRRSIVYVTWKVATGTTMLRDSKWRATK